MNNLKQKLKYILPVLVLLVVLVVGFGIKQYLHTKNVGILFPKGEVAKKEQHLIIIASVLAVVIIIPVYIMTFLIAWKYRAGNLKAKYSPDWDRNIAAETLWWLIPTIIITSLSIIVWNSTHELEPSKALSSSVAPLKIQVIALQWKWLFIYPNENIATVNYLKVPLDTPIDFEITSDAPMNSFWIPELGGQIYAMSGMSTNLHLIANKLGTYRGSSANISGEGFSHMNFSVTAVSNDEYSKWLNESNGGMLSSEEYNQIAQPGTDIESSRYSSVENDLYNKVVMKYLDPTISVPTMHLMDHNNHQ